MRLTAVAASAAVALTSIGVAPPQRRHPLRARARLHRSGASGTDQPLRQAQQLAALLKHPPAPPTKANFDHGNQQFYMTERTRIGAYAGA